MGLPGSLSDCILKTSSNGDSGVLIWKGNVKKKTYKGTQR